ncbi:flavin reductase [Nocardioides hungaricus]
MANTATRLADTTGARASASSETVALAAAQFIEAMSALPSAATIVATDGPGGRVGQTITSMCSVSADPPTVLFCIKHTSPLADAVVTNGIFAVNVLSCAQSDLAWAFAGRDRPEAPAYVFDEDWQPRASGAPVHTESSAWFDCELTARDRIGTHFVCMGRVLDSGVSHSHALTYGRRSFGQHQVLATEDRGA